jgi:hypothetical protein
MRTGVAFCAVLLIALLCVATASAAGPMRGQVVIDPVTFDEGVCPFPVTLEPVINREIAKEFSDRLIITGALTVRVTNETTSESIMVNASGPATFVSEGETSSVLYSRGRGLLIFFADDLGEGAEGALMLSRGLVIERFSEGPLEIVRLPRNMTNLCTVLAS